MAFLAQHKILVTGTSGFIGSALVAHLAAFGHETVALSRRPAGCVGAQEIRLASYLETALLADAMQGAGAVVHLAARAHQTSNATRQDEALFDDNVQTTEALLDAAKQAGVSRFVFISSVGVNGNQTYGTAFTENDNPAPAEAYARSKWRCEQRVMAAGVPYTVIRPPLVYGPHAPGNFGRLVRAVAHGVPLPLGTVHNQRSLVALDNLLDFITLCTNHPAAANQTYLVSDGEDISTTRLLQRTGQALNRPARLLPMPVSLLRAAGTLLGHGDTIARLCGSLQVDIGKARHELGWKPPLGVDEGLHRAVAHLTRP